MKYMPKKEEIVESNMNSSNCESCIDPDWQALKQEYDNAKQQEKSKKNILQKEKDDFAKMWIAAGLELKETLQSRCISSTQKKGN